MKTFPLPPLEQQNSAIFLFCIEFSARKVFRAGAKEPAHTGVPIKIRSYSAGLISNGSSSGFSFLKICLPPESSLKSPFLLLS